MIELNDLSESVIGCAIAVHKELGPGLLESAYEACLCHELTHAGIEYERQKELCIHYRGQRIDCGYRMDLVVEGRLVLEAKSVERLLPIHEAQLLTYLRLSGIHLGLLVNFNTVLLHRGIRRMVHGRPPANAVDVKQCSPL